MRVSMAVVVHACASVAVTVCMETELNLQAQGTMGPQSIRPTLGHALEACRCTAARRRDAGGGPSPSTLNTPKTEIAAMR